jgi:hypothetical protein
MITTYFFKIIRSFATLSIILLLVCCGGGGGGGSSATPEATTFMLFPNGYFSAGYQESFNLTGSDTVGGKYTGTFLFKTESPTTFNGEQAIPVSELISATLTGENATETQTGTDYYSDNANSRVDLGFENDTEGTTSIGISLSPIPQTASIGDFGDIGTYPLSNGNTETSNWRLTQAGNGLANLIETSTITDSTGNTISTTEITNVIDTDGNCHSITVVFYLENTGTVTLSSQ